MSNSHSNTTAKPGKRLSSRAWFLMSFMLSMGMACWVWSRPFAASTPVAETTKSKRPVELLEFSKDVAIRGGSTEEIRILANDIDRELLEALAERQGKTTPGASRVNRTHERWQQRVERAKRQIENLGEIEEGSIEQDFKNDRLRALEDAPRSF